MKSKVNIEQPVDEINEVCERLQKEIEQKKIELKDTHDSMNRLNNMRKMQDNERPTKMEAEVK